MKIFWIVFSNNNITSTTTTTTITTTTTTTTKSMVFPFSSGWWWWWWALINHSGFFLLAQCSGMFFPRFAILVNKCNYSNSSNKKMFSSSIKSLTIFILRTSECFFVKRKKNQQQQQWWWLTNEINAILTISLYGIMHLPTRVYHQPNNEGDDDDDITKCNYLGFFILLNW